MSVLAVIPAYHEEKRIGETIRSIQPFVDGVIVVDDGSRDATFERAKETGAYVLRHAVNRGQGAALRTGSEAAIRLGAEIVVHIDADGQHDPTSIPQLLNPIQSHEVDVVFGSRFLGQEAVGMPISRRALLTAAKTFNALVVGVPRRITDPQCGYRAMHVSAMRQIEFRQDGMAHCSEILRLVTRSDLRWREVPVQVFYSTDSLQKGQKPWNAAHIAWDLFLGAFVR